jgi:ATP-dependent DNA helicase RecG
MTATPIPRTITMSMYGDLDESIIDELPPGRTPIKTHWRDPGQRAQVYEGVRKLIDEGRQAYFVCPMVSESEKMLAQAAEEMHYRLSKAVCPDRSVDRVHGQMRPAEKEAAMERFRRGESQILVATTVIEVGVDVPNASVMVIEDANRFGLSQLHQLRGRVGRGPFQSFCILIAEVKSEVAQKRMEIMVESNDGFEIARADLEIRGPGDVAGTKQSGYFDFRLADLVQDFDVLQEARGVAQSLIAEDPRLERPEHRLLRDRAERRWSDVALITVS